MRNKLLNQVGLGLVLLSVITLLGTIFYSLVEDYSILEAFYMTIITISTTGFKEVRPLSDTGKILTIFVIISGVMTIAYTGGKAAQLIIETQLFRRKRMSKQLGKWIFIINVPFLILILLFPGAIINLFFKKGG